ncbi:hypothetical protein F2Q68_00042369 [Brassica cretica]|uniref:Uncharacterized protein n=1 Tax=Brassica cretica TaxID=69181 RepID=A0A8S9MFK6_BRACR|nr:hypothetical protein F2Q68_00042369 [Brassica cretica]
MEKDDPKVTALMQQAELLSSLAQKVNEDNTEQSMENAWKVFQDFMNKDKKNYILRYGLPDINFQLEEFRDLIDVLRSSYVGNSSEYSSGSTITLDQYGDRTQPSLPDTQTEHKEGADEFLSTCDVLKNLEENMPILGEENISSPIQVTPLFRSLDSSRQHPKSTVL